MNTLTGGDLATVHALAISAALLGPLLLAGLAAALAEDDEDGSAAVLIILPGFFFLGGIIWGWIWTIRLLYHLAVLNL